MNDSLAFNYEHTVPYGHKEIDTGQERDAIVNFPWHLYNYLNWQKDSAIKRSAVEVKNKSFFDYKCNFSVRPDDVPQRSGRVEIVDNQDAGVVLFAGNDRLEVLDVSREEAENYLYSLDGKSSVQELSFLHNTEKFTKFLNSCLGYAVEIPAEIDRLEEKIKGGEISRLPVSPYTIDRNYWNNMADLRLELAGLESAIQSGEEFRLFLCNLHITATMGLNLDTFYKPYSPIADQSVMPGAMYDKEQITMRTGREAFFITLLAKLLDDDSFGEADIIRADKSGIPWGTLGLKKINGDLTRVFRSFRPLQQRHFESLAADLRQAFLSLKHKNNDDVVRNLASFHQKYSRLMPFACANQCISMNIVNHILRKAINGFIPHLHLDMCAMEFSAESYLTIFNRAIDSFLIGIDEQSYYADVKRKVGRMSDFMEELSGLGMQPDKVVQLILMKKSDARLLLI